jgi:hypothetical protein
MAIVVYGAMKEFGDDMGLSESGRLAAKGAGGTPAGLT